MSEMKSKSVGTTTYYASPVDSISGLKIQTKIIKILGPGAKELFSKGAAKEKLKIVLPALLENFDDELVNQLVLDLFERNVFYDKKGAKVPVEFATHFTGKLMDIWKVVGLILEVNFNMGNSSGSNSSTTGKEKKK